MTPTDAVILALWMLLAIRNNAALLPLFVHFIFLLCFYLFSTNFPIFCITSISLFQAAQLNIKISSDLRYALFSLGCIYLLGAIDELLYYQFDNYVGVYFSSMPYLIIAMNAFIASLLFKDGGRTLAGFIEAARGMARNCLHRLYGIQLL